jgi:hypothetical protein
MNHESRKKESNYNANNRWKLKGFLDTLVIAAKMAKESFRFPVRAAFFQEKSVE